MLRAGGMGMALGALWPAGATAEPLPRAEQRAPSDLPNIQQDIDGYVAPAVAIDGTEFRFGPVYTVFVTARLLRTPTLRDQQVLAGALDRIEAAFPFRPEGVFLSVAYGLPYFERLPVALVQQHMPRLLLDQRRFALEEATPAPTDVHPDNPDVRKRRFQIPVEVERNDLLLTLRGDAPENLEDVLGWLSGSGSLGGEAVPSPELGDVLEVTSTRHSFVRSGMPRRVAEAHGVAWAEREPADSPLWMGFASQQANASGPAAITTFQGTESARFTDAQPDGYFADGSIQHLGHIVLDLAQWYEEPYDERVQLMFRPDAALLRGRADQFTDGGGPAYVANDFRGRDDARRSSIGANSAGGVRRIGHVSALQRASRAADGTPLHIRIDGSGFDSMDVPDGSAQPKLQFSIYVPTAEVFERMRRYQAAADLAKAYGVAERNNGLERFFTTTRIQNFLSPPRRHRAFPLLELV